MTARSQKDPKMKASRLTYLLTFTLALTFVATGCKKKQPNVTNIPNQRTTIGNQGGGDRSGQLGTDGNVTGSQGSELPANIIPEEMDNNREALRAQTVQFAYDSHAIRSGERAKVDVVAAYMKGAPGNVALLIEGHCDERGTEEYNRSLGEKRALALREALMGQGVDGKRVVTRSYGKDRKIDTGNSEAAHAKNRRGEFVVLTPK